MPSPVRQRSSFGNIHESPRSSRSSIDANSQRVKLTAQHFTGEYAEQAHDSHHSPAVSSRQSSSARNSQHQSASNSSRQQSAAELSRQHSGSSSPRNKPSVQNSQHQSGAKTRDEARQSAQLRQRLSAVVLDSSESSEDCDTAPSTISSRGDNKSSADSRDSASPPLAEKK